MSRPFGSKNKPKVGAVAVLEKSARAEPTETPTRRQPITSSYLNPLHGFCADRLNKCHDCQGPLRGPDGSYRQRMVEISGTQAYAASICVACQAKLNNTACNDPAEDLGRRLYCYLPPHHRGNHRYGERE